MSSSLASRLKHPKKHELMKSASQAQLLANKLRQDGVMGAVEGVVQAVDQVAALLASNVQEFNFKDSIINLCQHLKVYGAYLEILYKEQLDHAFKIFRDKAQDDVRVDLLSRLHLLELIELRAKGWRETDGMNLYYKKKVTQCSHVDLADAFSSLSESLASGLNLNNSSPPLLGPGEVLKNSGKFTRPTRIPGKKYCKDEVVIRNADSGKVMGIKGRRVHMIEELSETIISFQRVNPGAKERLVQITGANEESINHAKQLIEDTIRRNASPVREGSANPGNPLTGSSSSINSSASDDSSLLPSSATSRTNSRSSRALMHSLSTPDANLGEFKYSVITNGHTIKITGDNLDLVRTSKLVLDEYFSGEPIHDMAQFYSFDSLPNPPIIQEDLENSSKTIQSFLNGTPQTPPITPVKNEKTDIQQSFNNTVTIPKNNISLKVESSSSSSLSTKNRSHKYSIEVLAQLAMSPLCLSEPVSWNRILLEYPMLVRKVVQSFDADQYLTSRAEESAGILNVDENIDEDN